ncbi:alpha/beta hydrolase [Ascidiimonas aurantiaca]|uniref:alpha/beta fold hydrolase n=1 Tax=Ascidiimonas aurantiaca TaxID=1685432 RepID=UPI0030EF1494
MEYIIATEFGRVQISVAGNGKPILFLHGGHSSCNETLFHKGYDTRHYQLITPSRPGYGGTPLQNKKKPEEAAQLMAALLQKLAIKNVIVIGISAGGLTALALAALYPEKVEKLILISAVTKRWLLPFDAMYIKGKKLFSPRREKMSWALFRFFFHLFPGIMARMLFKQLSTKKNARITREEILEIKDMTFRQRSGEGFVTDLDQQLDEHLISQIQCPVLILHSKNDKSVSPEMATYARQKIKNATLKMYDNTWGHLLWVGEESKYPQADVNSFIQS